MERVIKSKALARNFEHVVPPGGLRFLDFARLELKPGESNQGKSEARELVVDIFTGDGTATVKNKARKDFEFQVSAGRPDVFSGPPGMIYIPPQAEYKITGGKEKLDTGIFSAPSTSVDTPPAYIPPKDAVAKEVGKANWQRTVYSSLADNIPAERLLAGETITPSGNWSSYPPHKHDKNNPPHEAPLEEVYYFRTKPAGGSGMIWTYTDPKDKGPDSFNNVFVVEDGDTVLLPKGYHPVVAAPGYELHYTWVLAGEERRYGAWAEDPRFAWVGKS